jgi:TRAP-type uncharacterized transport system fused permease subunit
VFFLIATENESTMAIPPPTGLKLIAAWVLIFLVLEATRRVMGLQLVLFTAGFLLYAKFGNYIPEIVKIFFEHNDECIANYASIARTGVKELELVKGEPSSFHLEALHYYRERGRMK